MKKELKKIKKILGPLGPQVILDLFKKNKKEKKINFFFAPGALGLLRNLFLKTLFLFFQSLQDFPKTSLSKTLNFFQKPSFQENTRRSIWQNFFQIMMINCFTNQFVPKRDLISFNSCMDFAKHSKYDKKMS